MRIEQREDRIAVGDLKPGDDPDRVPVEHAPLPPDVREEALDSVRATLQVVKGSKR